MNLHFLQEPELAFGTGRHIDIRFGLMHHGPLDYASPLAPKQIKLGIVGTPQTIEGVTAWLDKCGEGIDAKPSKQPNLFPRFPGLGPDESFRCSLVADAQLQRPIRQNILEKLARSARGNALVREAVDLIVSEFGLLVENASPDVLVCAIPMDLLEAMDDNSGGDEEDDTEPIKSALNFHHLLKARAMGLRRPVQIILPTTYDKSTRRRQKTNPERIRVLQDEATIAWNIHTAFYYKAGGVPWRLVRDPSKFTTCYIGISFYKSLDASRIMTSTAQVFDQRGEGVIVRGGAAKISKDDRQPHLSIVDAQRLLDQALERYREVHGTSPARVVLHKSSPFNYDEIDGFSTAVSLHRIDLYDFVSVGASLTRLFRAGPYPTLRGTMLSLDDKKHILYTRGGVDFFETYPGQYVPKPLLFRCDSTSETPKALAQEILALTKMNWNNTQFDGREPITIRAARQVSAVLKYVPEGSWIEPKYSSYM